MGRKDAFNLVKQVGIIPAIRSSQPEQALRAAEAICEGGISIVEVSLALPRAIQVLKTVADAHAKNMLVGAGSVTTAKEVRLAFEAGARFIVTPGFSADAITTAAELDVASFAGALTPTEVQIAAASGADAVKLFPCYATGGARYLKALRGQYPHIDLIASGGIGVPDCDGYFRAGACAIGVGGEIADAESMAANHFRVFTVRAKRFREAIRKAIEFRGSTAVSEVDR